MREVMQRVYKFEELSSEARERVCVSYATLVGTDDLEFVLDGIRHMGKVLGIEIHHHHTDVRREGVYFSGLDVTDKLTLDADYEYRVGSVEEIQVEAPQDEELQRIAVALRAAAARYDCSVIFSLRSSGVICSYFEEEDEPLSWQTRLDCEDEVTQLLRDFMSWAHLQLRKEYEYQTHEEQVAENCEANGYEFDEDGELHRQKEGECQPTST